MRAHLHRTAYHAARRTYTGRGFDFKIASTSQTKYPPPSTPLGAGQRAKCYRDAYAKDVTLNMVGSAPRCTDPCQLRGHHNVCRLQPRMAVSGQYRYNLIPQ
eukprot:6174528-Pleurochrysis_carterae.AAC.1